MEYNHTFASPMLRQKSHFRHPLVYQQDALICLIIDFRNLRLNRSDGYGID